MKLRNGFPTKAAIEELCDKYNLPTLPIDSFYTKNHCINFSRTSRNDVALLVKSELDKLFVTEFRAADSSMAINGQIKILSKLEDKICH